MKLSKKKAALLPIALLALLLSACGGGANKAEESASEEVAGTQANKLTEDQTDGALVSLKGVFGETTAIEGGIDVTVSQPMNFMPSADAQNYTEELTVTPWKSRSRMVRLKILIPHPLCSLQIQGSIPVLRLLMRQMDMRECL